MNIASALSVPLRDPQMTLGVLDVGAAARLVEAAGDLVLIVDDRGVVVDFAMASHELAIEGSDGWIGRNWLDIVTSETRG